MNNKIVVKEDVRQHVERLKEELSVLYACVEGDKLHMQIELGISDDTKFADTSYVHGDLAEVDLNQMEDCLSRVKHELMLLGRTVKRRVK